jgi:2-keto-3-deoxy-L-rhamnonate aldolase RhmA
MTNNIAETKNKVKKALLERKVTLGAWIQTGSTVAAEVFANAGFDWIAADIEHTDIDISKFQDIARGMYGRGALPMARVRENDTLAIRQVLDTDAQGVIVPFVNSQEQAKKAVQAAKYPPDGIRGFAFCRANNWGTDFESYVKSANNDIAVVVMIESREAVEKIDEILEVKGVDGIFIGPYDMSGSYGITGQTSNPIIREACVKISKACEKYGKSAGIHIVIPIKKAVDEGFTFIALGIDTVFLDQAARKAIQAAK